MNTHVTYSELADFITGRMEKDREESISAHVKDCAQCGKMMENMQWAKRHLLNLSQHMDEEHPDPELVLSYLHGELESEVAEWVKRHLDQCEECWLTDEVVNDVFNLRLDQKEWVQNNFSADAGEQAVWEMIHQKLSVSVEQEARVSKFRELLANIGDRLKVLESVKEFFYLDSISLTGLVPALATAEFAASEDDFEEEKKETQDSPFTLTLYKFGKEYRIHVKTDAPIYQESLLLVRFFEGPFERYNTLVLLHKGEGEYRIQEAERILAAPVKKNLQTAIEVLWPIPNLEEAQKEKVATNFAELLVHSSPDIRLFLLNVLAELRVKSVLNAISILENDPEERVRLAAIEAVKTISIR